MHESTGESPNFTNICIFRGENAYLWRNFNVICSVHTFFHIFSKLLPEGRDTGKNKMSSMPNVVFNAKNAQQCRKMPKNARKCPKMPENAQKCHKMPKNATKCQKIVKNAQKMPKMPKKIQKCQFM
jgi:hypothetical protein